MSDPLGELRAIFWDEVEDALETLDREGLTVAPASPPDEATARARYDEAYRLMHSLKGASRAVGFADIEALCHATEERLGAMSREAAARGVAPVFEVDVARVTDALRVALGAARAASRTPTDEGARALTRATAEMENAPDPRAQLASAATATTATTATTGDTTGEETIRVPLTRLGRLLRASDHLVEQLAGHDEDARAFDQLDQGLLDAIVELSKARRALGGSDAEARLEGQRRIEAALAGIRALTGWSVERRAAEGRWRANLDGSGSAIGNETRALRMVPLASLGPALERAAQDAARSLGKRVTFRFEPREVELDRKVRDGLREPLLHAVRNCVDHGLEREDERVARGKSRDGTVTVRARVAGSELALSVEDDGRGVDEDALAILAAERGIDLTDLARRDRLGLLLRPGWSTRRDVSAFSGRGVGLDVVRQRIAALRGRVELESTPDQGTSLLLQVPLDLSATRLVVFTLGDAKLALVTSCVERLVRVAPAELAVVGGQLHLPRRVAGDLVPLADLLATLGLPARSFSESDRAFPCLLVVAGDRRIALRVDALTDERDAIVTPLHPRLRSVPFVLATTLLAEGEIALVLDAPELARSAVRAMSGPTATAASSLVRARRILLVDDSVTTLQLERTLLENAGFEVKTASDGEQALTILESDERFDALVTDIEMPRLDGLSLAARVRRRAATSALPIVLVTGLAQDEQRHRALEIGVNAYIVKGRFDEDELVGILEQLT
jgi:two-component system chemotaxis sensor kinase CheA